MKSAVAFLSVLAMCIADGSYYEQNNEYYEPAHWKEAIRPTYRPAPLNEDGTVAETPEVVAAKEYHLNVHAEAAKKGLEAANDGWDRADPRYFQYSSAPEDHKPKQYQWPQQNQVPQQILVWKPQPTAYQYVKPQAPSNSYVPEAPVRPVAQWSHTPQPIPQPMPTYPAPHTYVPKTTSEPTTYHKSTYPPAPLNEDGTVAETPEIMALKAKHLDIFEEVKARALAAKAHELEYSSAQEGQYAYTEQPSAPRTTSYYHGGDHKAYSEPKRRVHNKSY